MADAPMPPPPPDTGMLAWPWHTERLVLRPVTMDDVDVAATYRGDPQVTRHLRHGCLTREQVVERHRERVRRMAPGAPDPMLGLAIEHEGRMVGDCMLDLCRGEPGRGDAISLLFGLDLRSGPTWSITASNG